MTLPVICIYQNVLLLKFVSSHITPEFFVILSLCHTDILTILKVFPCQEIEKKLLNSIFIMAAGKLSSAT